MAKNLGDLFQPDPIDSIDSYFECVTACTLENDSVECLTRCVEVHLKMEE